MALVRAIVSASGVDCSVVELVETQCLDWEVVEVVVYIVRALAWALRSQVEEAVDVTASAEVSPLVSRASGVVGVAVDRQAEVSVQRSQVVEVAADIVQVVRP